MAFHPLDLQIVIGQSDFVGKEYLRIYTAPRKDQFFHSTHYEQRTKDIDHKVLDLPEEVSEYQADYLDAHDAENARKNVGSFKKREYYKKESKAEKRFKELDKGNFVDVLR